MSTRVLDFIVIGAPRSGTTSLFRHLREHPQIYIPPGKELPFFSDDSWYSKGWEAFLKEFFSNAPPDALWGKITPHYWEDPRVPERIHAAMPDVKLVALLRNPVDRLYSHYRFLVRRGVEPRSFEDAVLDPKGKKYHYYFPLGEYRRILDLYLEHFRQDQLHVLWTEDLEKNPAATLDKLFGFLGVRQGFMPDTAGKKFNQGGTKTRFRWLIKLARRTPARKVWHSLPASVRAGIGKYYFFQIAPVKETAAPLDPEVRSRLVSLYKPQVKQLEELLREQVPWSEFQI